MKFIKKYFIKSALKAVENSKVRPLNPQYKWKILYDRSTEDHIGELSHKLQSVLNCNADDIISCGVSEDGASPYLLSYGSFNWLGDLDDAAIDEALLAPCEYLIIYTENAGLLIRYLASNMKSRLQIGIQNNELDNNLTINVSAKETSIFVKELKRYIVKINFEHEAV